MALATGAASGLAEQTVKAGYTQLKTLLESRFSLSSINSLEQKPKSKIKQESVAEDLAESGADKDEEVLAAAQALIKLIETHAPEAAEAAGISIDQLKAGGSININNLAAPGNISITGVMAGMKESPSTPKD